MNNPSTMNWHVLGAGAIGGLWASHLALAGFPVTLLLRDQSAASRFAQSPLILQAESETLRPAVNAIHSSALNESINWLLVRAEAKQPMAMLKRPMTKMIV